jgi:S-adenosylmethionine synthetase
MLRPIYSQTAAYGHFGRELPDFTWERADRVEALQNAVG